MSNPFDSAFRRTGSANPFDSAFRAGPSNPFDDAFSQSRETMEERMRRMQAQGYGEPALGPEPEQPGLWSPGTLKDFGKGVLGASAELGSIAKTVSEVGSELLPGGNPLEALKYIGGERDEVDEALDKAIEIGREGRHGLRERALDSLGTGVAGIAAATVAGSAPDVLDPAAMIPVTKVAKGAQRISRGLRGAQDALSRADDAVEVGRLGKGISDAAKAQEALTARQLEAQLNLAEKLKAAGDSNPQRIETAQAFAALQEEVSMLEETGGNVADLARLSGKRAAARAKLDELVDSKVQEVEHNLRQSELFPGLNWKPKAIPDGVWDAAVTQREAGRIAASAGGKPPEVLRPAIQKHYADLLERKGPTALIEDIPLHASREADEAVGALARVESTAPRKGARQPEGYKPPEGVLEKVTDFVRARFDYFKGGPSAGAEVHGTWQYLVRGLTDPEKVLSHQQTARRFTRPEQQSFILKKLPKLYERRQHELAARAVELNDTMNTYRRAVRRFAGRNPDMDVTDVERLVVEKRELGALNELPQEIRKEAEQVGRFFDDLADEVSALPSAPEPLRKALQENKGRYFTHAYEVHKNQEWATHVQQSAKWDEMHDLIARRFPEMSEDEVVGKMYRYLQGHAEHSEVARKVKSGGGKDLSEFKARKLDSEKADDQIIQNFLGLRHDFGDVMEMSGARLLYDLETHRWMEDIVEEGLKSGVFTEKAVGRYTHRVAGGLQGKTSPGGASLTASKKSPLDNVYAPPEVHQMFDLVLNEDHRQAAGFLTAFNSMAKGNQLFSSVGTHNRNFVSGASWAMMQGLDVAVPAIRHMGRSAAKVADNVGLTKIVDWAGDMHPSLRKAAQRIGGDEAARAARVADTAETTRLGVRQAGSLAGELGQHQGYLESFLGKTKVGRAALETKAGKAVRGVGKATQKLYAEGDNFWKDSMFRGLKRRYQDLGVGSNDEVSAAFREVYGTDNIDDAVADVIMDTMQTYSRTAPIARVLSKNPIVGTFTSFPAEITRNIANVMRTAAKEAAVARRVSGLNKTKWYARAGSRIVGLASSLGVFSVAAQRSAEKIGWTKDTDDAYRRQMAPEWNQNSEIRPVRQEGDEITVSISDQVDPTAVVKNLGIALISGEDMSDKLLGFAEELENQFVGTEIGTMALLELALKQKVTGNVSDLLAGDGVRPQDPGGTSGERWGSALHRFARQVEPQILEDVENMLREEGVLRGNIDSREFERGETLKKWVGPLREETKSVSKQYEYRTSSIGYKARKLDEYWNDELRNARTPAAHKRLLERQEEEWNKVQDEAIQMIEDFRTLGLPDNKIYARLKRRPSVAIAKAWMGGTRVPYSAYRPKHYDLTGSLRKQGIDVREARDPQDKARIRFDGF